MKKPLILIATGGTGGHIFPSLAFIESLDKFKYKYLLLADKRFLNFKSQIQEGMHYQIIMSSSLAGGLTQKLFSLLKILLGTLQALLGNFAAQAYCDYKFRRLSHFSRYGCFKVV